jgi:hypothetical protein
MIQPVRLSFEAVFARIKALLRVTKDVEIAREFEIDPDKFYVWKGREFIPIEMIMSWCDEKGYSINHVLLGKGPLYINEMPGNQESLLEVILRLEDDVNAIPEILELLKAREAIRNAKSKLTK